MVMHIEPGPREGSRSSFPLGTAGITVVARPSAVSTVPIVPMNDPGAAYA